MKKRLVIIGASGHGKVVADIAFQMKKYDEILFLDDDKSKRESMGIQVVGDCGDVSKYISNADFIVAIGNGRIRQMLIEKLEKQGADLTSLIHPKAVIGQNVTLGSGTVVMANAVINPDSIVGKGCIINTSASVDHDCEIGDFVHVSVGAHVCGAVQVGYGSWIGAGVVIKNNIKICNECVIGAGAVVVNNIEDVGTYIGVPARRMI